MAAMSVHASAVHVPLSAVLLIVVSVAFFSVTEATAKYLTASYPILLLVWTRYAMQAAMLAVWFGPRMGLGLVRAPRMKLQVIRAGVLIVSSICFFNALAGLPLADATAIVYCAPVLVVLIAVVFLKERMTPMRWAFVVTGFVGMLLIVRPGASIFHGAALYALAAATTYAIFQTMTRHLAETEDSRVLLFMPALCGTIVMAPAVPLLVESYALPWRDLGLICLMGALGTTGHFLFIRAFQRAPASALTPFSYTQLIWSTVLGWLVFGQFPDRISLVGIAIIAGSGLLLGWHERRRRPLTVAPNPTAID
jgi:drug/metabolite transporter (DMT)-like permease